MVQVDISQLSAECSSWRETLRQLRDEFNNDEVKLRQAATPNLSRELLQDVEHLHNQFHIQLINIHDLKQAIKSHERQLALNEQPEAQQASHDTLFAEYQSLQATLKDLRTEFNEFLHRTR